MNILDFMVIAILCSVICFVIAVSIFIAIIYIIAMLAITGVLGSSNNSDSKTFDEQENS